MLYKAINHYNIFLTNYIFLEGKIDNLTLNCEENRFIKSLLGEILLCFILSCLTFNPVVENMF